MATLLGCEHMKYQVLFENRFGVERIIGYACSFNEAFRVVSKFCEKRNYKIPYVREWVAGGRLVQDVGSHTEFFYVAREDGGDLTLEEYLEGTSREETTCHI